jgi:hypothetical protein
MRTGRNAFKVFKKEEGAASATQSTREAASVKNPEDRAKTSTKNQALTHSTSKPHVHCPEALFQGRTRKRIERLVPSTLLRISSLDVYRRELRTKT